MEVGGGEKKVRVQRVRVQRVREDRIIRARGRGRREVEKI